MKRAEALQISAPESELAMSGCRVYLSFPAYVHICLAESKQWKVRPACAWALQG